MRARNAFRDLLVSAMLAALVVWGCGLHAAGIERDRFTYWAITSITVTGAITALLASILGAAAMPHAGEFESIQGALLTRLTSLDICAGRLIAGIWIPLTMVLASTAFWLCASLFAARIGISPRYSAVVGANLTILVFSFALGAMAFACSVRRRLDGETRWLVLRRRL